jgi:8-oxo-dGTP pyrophosphatase MutT (NUDIX family)
MALSKSKSKSEFESGPEVIHPARLSNFTSPASLSPFTVPYKTYIANLDRLKAETPASQSSYHYQHIAVGALVFCSQFDSRSQLHSDGTRNTHTDANADNQPADLKLVEQEQEQEPRILLLRRSPQDSMPLRWEPPGGACDPDDPSILHACARELWEEAGLVTKSIVGVIDPDGRVFCTRSGKAVCKFEFFVDVDLGAGVDGEAPRVSLDPNEHVDFVWATEGECVAGQRTGEGEEQCVELVFTNEAQRVVVLEAFRRVKNVKQPIKSVSS